MLTLRDETSPTKCVKCQGVKLILITQKIIKLQYCFEIFRQSINMYLTHSVIMSNYTYYL